MFLNKALKSSVSNTIYTYRFISKIHTHKKVYTLPPRPEFISSSNKKLSIPIVHYSDSKAPHLPCMYSFTDLSPAERSIHPFWYSCFKTYNLPPLMSHIVFACRVKEGIAIIDPNGNNDESYFLQKRQLLVNLSKTSLTGTNRYPIYSFDGEQSELKNVCTWYSIYSYSIWKSLSKRDSYPCLGELLNALRISSVSEFQCNFNKICKTPHIHFFYSGPSTKLSNN